LISIIVYGRNDNHGNNLDKRVSLSLNNFANFLNEKDEIIFVDWNSPRNLKTFPERISDTLTPKCKEILKVIKVDESIHQKVKGETLKPTIEPIARNVGIRRASKDSKWILSTNTDMLFIQKDKNLSIREKIQSLEAGYYAIPRFEIPEYLWELFDRVNPIQTNLEIEELCRSIPLKYVVTSNYANLFDAPGDFQLFLRDDAMKIRGFNEKMIWGWHVDSNLSKRLFSLYGQTQSLSEFIEGYHCNHSTVKTHYTRGERTNDVNEYVVKDQEIVANFDVQWGLGNYDLPVINLDERKQKSLKFLKSYGKDKHLVSTVNTHEVGNRKFRDTNVSSIFIFDQLKGSKVYDVLIYSGRNKNFEENIFHISQYFGLRMLNIEKTDIATEIDESAASEKHYYFLLDFSVELPDETKYNEKTNKIDPKMDIIIEQNINILFKLQSLLQQGKIQSHQISLITHNLDYAMSLGIMRPLVSFPTLAGAYSGMRKVELKDSFIFSSPTRMEAIRLLILSRKKLFLPNSTLLPVSKNSRKLLKKSFGSHTLEHLFQSKKGFLLNYRGTMIQSGDTISLKNRFVEKDLGAILELDFPADTHIYKNMKIGLKIGSNGSSINQVINPREHIITLLNALGSDKILIDYYSDANYVPEFYSRLFLLRMTNLKFFNMSKIRKNRFYWASNVISSVFYKQGWSYSNEIYHRQAVGQVLEVDLSYAPKNSKKIFISFFCDSSLKDSLSFFNQDNLPLNSHTKKYNLFISPSNTLYSIKLTKSKIENIKISFSFDKNNRLYLLENDKLLYSKFVYFSRFENPILALLIVNLKYTMIMTSIKIRKKVRKHRVKITKIFSNCKIMIFQKQ
jgi:hypothetical protein